MLHAKYGVRVCERLCKAACNGWMERAEKVIKSARQHSRASHTTYVHTPPASPRNWLPKPDDWYKSLQISTPRTVAVAIRRKSLSAAESHLVVVRSLSSGVEATRVVGPWGGGTWWVIGPLCQLHPSTLSCVAALPPSCRVAVALWGLPAHLITASHLVRTATLTS